MNFITKLFNKFRSPKHSQSQGISDYNLQWVEIEDSPWNIKVLDLRPVSQGLTSFSYNNQGADNSLSYNLEDGRSFMNLPPVTNKFIDVDCSVPIKQPLEEGVLFRPYVMEHKWAIFYRENKIIVVRGWQREVFVVADTHQEENKLVITKIHGKFVFDEEPEAFTKTTLLFLLHGYCIGDIVPVPIPEDLLGDTNEAAIWVFKKFGNLAHYGFAGMNFDYQTTNYLKSNSLLHLAVANEDINLINKAIKNGFDIHSFGTNQFTPLQWSLSVNPKILIHLIEKGTNVNLADKEEGETALMSAAQLNKLEHLKLLLHYNARINATNKKGFTALHQAAETGHLKIVQYLLNKGADHTILAQEHSPLSLAIMSKHKKIIKLLKRVSL
jgi:hypothetical protein